MLLASNFRSMPAHSCISRGNVATKVALTTLAAPVSPGRSAGCPVPVPPPAGAGVDAGRRSGARAGPAAARARGRSAVVGGGRCRSVVVVGGVAASSVRGLWCVVGVVVGSASSRHRCRAVDASPAPAAAAPDRPLRGLLHHDGRDLLGPAAPGELGEAPTPQARGRTTAVVAASTGVVVVSLTKLMPNTAVAMAAATAARPNSTSGLRRGGASSCHSSWRKCTSGREVASHGRDVV